MKNPLISSSDKSLFLTSRGHLYLMTPLTPPPYCISTDLSIQWSKWMPGPLRTTGSLEPGRESLIPVVSWLLSFCMAYNQCFKWGTWPTAPSWETQQLNLIDKSTNVSNNFVQSPNKLFFFCPRQLLIWWRIDIFIGSVSAEFIFAHVEKGKKNIWKRIG